MRKLTRLAGLIFSLLSCPCAYAHDSNDSDVQDAWGDYQAQVSGDWKTYQTSAVEQWRGYEDRLSKKWGKQTLIPEKKVYAKYYDGDQVRVRIDYEKGEIKIESLDPKRMKSPTEARTLIDKLVTDGLLDPKELPDRLTWESGHDQVTGGDGNTRDRKTLKLEMSENHLDVRARRYLPIIMKWSEKNQVDPAFVLAVIERESAFNPRARSWAPAYGLMQIVPESAGAEVLHVTPSEDFLYDPENNIRVGTEYLKLLEQNHFSDIAAGDKRDFLVTCSYNWGPHRIRKAIERGSIDLSKSPDALFENLLAVVPVETKGYLRGVIESYRRFRSYQY